MKKLLFVGILLVPLMAIEQINIKFNKTNTMCAIVSKQDTIDTSKCDSIVVYNNAIYCILK